MYGLIDCNNFFVSCERVFNPALVGKPVVVAGNNDGCAVAMSNEAKAIGLRRGVPIFQVRDLVDRNNVIVLSGNHRLYGDLSARVMATIESVIPDIEVYSIDEAFIVFPDVDSVARETLAREIVRRVRRNVGIPTSLGIAPTKTLAKVAARFAKKYPGYRSVCLIDSDERRRKALELTDIEDIWGIGRKLAARLRQVGIDRAIDFADLSKSEVERLVNVVGQRTWRELNGTPCVERDPEYQVRKQICTTRTFTPSVTELTLLEEAISGFMTIASRKLRRQGSAAKGVSVFLQTNTYRTDLEQYHNSAYRPLEEPTNDQMTLISNCVELLRSIYRPGLLYRRAGVYITETVPIEAVQPGLFISPEDRAKRRKLNALIDEMNTNPMLFDKLRVATCRLDRRILSHPSQSYSATPGPDSSANPGYPPPSNQGNPSADSSYYTGAAPQLPLLYPSFPINNKNT